MTSAAKKILLTGIGLFILIKLIIIFGQQRVLWWDEAIYLNMAQFIASLGQHGMWEILRPPLWPLLLAPFSLFTNAYVAGLLLQTVIAITIAALTYVFLRERTDATLAALCALFALFFPVAFEWSGFLLTGYLAGGLILAAAYTYSKDRHVLTGVLLALAFLTRFPAGIAIVGFGLMYAYDEIRALIMTRSVQNQEAKNALRFAIPIAAILFVWMGINWLAWHHETANWWHAALRPLIFGADTALTEGQWLYDYTPMYYVKLLLFTLPVSVLALCAKTRKQLLPAFLTTILALVFFSSITNQQDRFILLIAPMLYVLIGLGADRVVSWNASLRKPLYVLLVLMIIGGVAAGTHTEFTRPAPNQQYYDVMDYFEQHPIDGAIITNDPRVTAAENNKILPVYYEGLRYFESLLDEEHEAVVFIPGNFPCFDDQCEAERRAVIDKLTSTHHLSDVLIYWDTEYYFFFTHQMYGSENTSSLREAYGLSVS